VSLERRASTLRLQMNGAHPQRYFADLLTRLVNGWPQSRIDELMPWHWAPAKNG
jgi:transposase